MLLFPMRRGQLILGVGDDHRIKGLSPEDLRRKQQLISNTANENVKPPIYPLVQQLQVEGKQLLLVQVRKGSTRPYATNAGVYLTNLALISGECLRKNYAGFSQRVVVYLGKKVC
ncbi:MAG: ATP-binding protein [SAR324 cluster bacterium]|nr:ATP-binding protein [SAR324 cluster bacterium]